jgi:2-C-methyl-D-erythritol 2,4-cyclodiphosphate synthase
MTYRTGLGTDVHPLVAGRSLVLGGYSVPFEMGLDGHSDGDVLVHAVIDALLGAAALGDIGAHFPSSDPGNARISSIVLLKRTVEKVRDAGWRATFVDATIVAQRPTLAPHIGRIRAGLVAGLSLDETQVNVKATTTDGLGFTGRGEGIAALAVATLESAGA